MNTIGRICQDWEDTSEKLFNSTFDTDDPFVIESALEMRLATATAWAVYGDYVKAVDNLYEFRDAYSSLINSDNKHVAKYKTYNARSMQQSIEKHKNSLTDLFRIIGQSEPAKTIWEAQTLDSYTVSAIIGEFLQASMDFFPSEDGPNLIRLLKTGGIGLAYFKEYQNNHAEEFGNFLFLVDEEKPRYLAARQIERFPDLLIDSKTLKQIDYFTNLVELQTANEPNQFVAKYMAKDFAETLGFFCAKIAINSQRTLIEGHDLDLAFEEIINIRKLVPGALNLGNRILESGAMPNFYLKPAN